MKSRTRGSSLPAGKKRLAALTAGLLLCALLLAAVLHSSCRLPFDRLVDRMTVFSLTRGKITRAFYTEPDGSLVLFYADFCASGRTQSRHIHQPVSPALRGEIQEVLRGLDYSDLPGENALSGSDFPAFELVISDDTPEGSLTLTGLLPPGKPGQQLLDALCAVFDRYVGTILDSSHFFAEYADYWHPLVAAMSGIYAGTGLPHEQITCRPLALQDSPELSDLIGSIRLPGLTGAYLCEAPAHSMLGLSLQRLEPDALRALGGQLAQQLGPGCAVFSLDPEDADTSTLFAAFGDAGETAQIAGAAAAIPGALQFTPAGQP